MKKIIMISLVLVAIFLLSGQAFAWHRGHFGVFVGPPLWVGPPAFYSPGYDPPPVYYSSPYRVWMRGHWESRWTPYGWQRAWIPGYWSYR